MDSDANSTPIRWIQPSGGLEKTRVIVDATSRDPRVSPAIDVSEHIQKRKTRSIVKIARAALKIGKGVRRTRGRMELENARREDIGLVDIIGVVALDGNILDLVPHNSHDASGSTRHAAKRQATVNSRVDDLPPKKKKTQQTLEAPHIGSRTTKLSNRQSLAAQYNHALHSRSSVQDIKHFLSEVSYTYGLFIHTKPIAFSSSKEKKRLKHIKKSQEWDTFKSWTREPLNGAACRIGFFSTWTRTWVGMTEEELKTTPWHVWVAVIRQTKDSAGKDVLIYDSNSDLFSEEEVLGEKLLGRQHALLTYLKEKFKINNI
jgi:hypothetical protein